MTRDPLTDLDRTSLQLAEVAAEAGRLLAAVADRAGGRCIKADGSPSTAADLASERMIIDRLHALWPDIPVVGEESVAAVSGARLFFLVDPLDGTKDYISGAGEYSVNIALVAGDRPVAAAIAVPEAGRVWIAGDRAQVGAMSSGDVGDWTDAKVRRPPTSGLVALVSRRHGDDETDACLSGLSIAERRTASSAYKFCLIASGEADIYVRCGPTMEWDTAAGDHIVARAGGVVVGPTIEPLAYGRAASGYLNGPFAALGDAELSGQISLPAVCPG